MNYEVIKINDNSWRIEDGDVRFFVLTGTDKALLIDTGMTQPDAKEAAESITDLPLMLLNTHADMDHVAGNCKFDSFYMHPAEEPNYRRGGREGTIIPVKEGDVIDLGGRKLEVIHIPGHTPGSIALLDEEARVLISGDPIQNNGRIFMFGDQRNMKDYITSLEHLEKWKDKFDEIWPSHADFPVSPELIERLHDGTVDILAGKVESAPAELFGRKIARYDLGFSTLLCDE